MRVHESELIKQLKEAQEYIDQQKNDLINLLEWKRLNEEEIKKLTAENKFLKDQNRDLLSSLELLNRK